MALANLAGVLDRNEFDPILVVPGDGPLVEYGTSQGVACVVVPNPEQSAVAAGWADKVGIVRARVRAVRELAALFRSRKCDIVYVNSTASIVGGLAAKAARLPVVWHVHETLSVPSRSTRLKMQFIERVSSAIMYASASSEEAFPASRVRNRLIARNLVDLHGCSARAPLDGSPVRIAMNGLFPRKAPDLFLRAVPALLQKLSHAGLSGLAQSVRFVVYGAPGGQDRDFIELLETLVRDLGLGPRVEFPGFVRDFPRALSESSLFVSSSRNEAMPIALVQAMAMSVPIVATDVGDTRLLLRNGDFGEIVPPEDVPALSEAMFTVLSHPERAAAKAALAKDFVLQEYEPRKVMEPVESLLKKVCKGRTV